MVQVKKDIVRDRIIDAAARLFEKKGYVECTISEIAKHARIGAASVYVYFPSKLDIVFAVYEPWILARIAETEIEAAKIVNLRSRLEYVLKRFWHVLPHERNHYLRSFLQALAVSAGDDSNKSRLYAESRDRISRLVYHCLPEDRKKDFDTASMADIIIMAFDGFVINSHLECGERVIAMVCDLILGKPHRTLNSRERRRDTRSNQRLAPR
ncbi:TetR/AcrR family transcriptional regulator [Reyranella sp. CPCC 100927]|uniref:TetR/AcrR family transcriptional regulator n=1 Tax=Reyranella sp. CPCC 100927 TaxID=2599616 RepID=UPI0011B3BE94|nr:TetR/AcrR family transcriptional regulator [Reyranella sp. CPCC 100927]TWT12645.1 TetR/AcrR family transcriptional regulator [Reyranella sp. CPCC 100927]